MAGLLGGNRQVGTVAPAYTGLQIQTSSGIVCVPLCWGMARGAPNVIWYGDFSAKAQHASGKGAGPTTGYDYHASLVMALCQGPITGIGKAWVNSGNSVSLAQTGFTLISLGNTPQAPWSYLVSNYPSQALAYNGIAYVAAVKYDLGSSPYAPSTSYEVKGRLYNTCSAGTGDADPGRMAKDFIGSDNTWSVGIPSAMLQNFLSTSAATTTGDGAYQTYCTAMGFGLSPFIQNQEQALGILDRWTQLTNSAVVWTGYALKIIPYGDQTITAHGVTYLPDITPVYDLTDADYVAQKNEDPIQITRKDPADCYNSVRIEINDRAHFYDATPVQLQDLDLIQKFGIRQDTSVQATEVCDATMAGTMVQLILQRKAYLRNTFDFELGAPFDLLEPMDVVQILDPVLGTFSVRITDMEETENGTYKIVAEELTAGLSSPGGTFVPQTGTSTVQNQLVQPAAVNTPIIFEYPSTMTNGIATLGAAVSAGPGGANDPNYGGCNVWLSLDNATYTQIGTLQGQSRMGVTTALLAAYGGANPDTINTLAVNMAESAGQLTSAPAATAPNANMSYLGGEFLSFETATLASANNYNVTNMWRGLNGSTPGSHAIGTAFARLDTQIFNYQLPTAYIGQLLYLKFQSFNIFGLQPQDLSTCTAYTFTPTGLGFGGGSNGVPVTPTGLTATPGSGQVALTWNANVATDNVTAYRVFRAPGTGASFGSAAQIAQINSLAYTDTGLPASTGYTYFLEAVNVVGPSTNTSGVNATTSSSGSASGSTGTATITGGTVNNNSACYLSPSGIQMANATDLTKPCNCWVKTGAASGSITYFQPGQYVGGGYSNWTTYWLDVTSGGITATPPSTSGNGTQSIGVTDGSGNLFFNPMPMTGFG